MLGLGAYDSSDDEDERDGADWKDGSKSWGAAERESTLGPGKAGGAGKAATALPSALDLLDDTVEPDFIKRNAHPDKAVATDAASDRTPKKRPRTGDEAAPETAAAAPAATIKAGPARLVPPQMMFRRVNVSTEDSR